MAKKELNIKKVLILGSAALKIGEAGEFDYSGSQAAKALKEEKVETIIVNPNIATIQTSPQFADKIYFLPVTPFFVEKIIAKEKPEGILLGFGGQTALNCGLAMAGKGVLSRYKVRVLGTPISAIQKTEDRLEFRECIKKLGLKVPHSVLCRNLNEIKKYKDQIQFPVIVRAGFSLGGLGSGIARNINELYDICQKALSLTPQVLIEEYLEHWKEIEYEVVRDSSDNAITVCDMENIDPMGVHTGDSIVVAPSQTLNNFEYHKLREIAIKVIKSLPVVGECNIQYALSPKDGDYRIIEVNARLSRSSALASKATGYPLAYVAAKLALGYSLSEIPNQVTRATSAFFEPALDYIVVKIPRWDFLKFKDLDERLGSEMRSVGEVMAIGRTFEEAFQKAIRSLDLDYEGVIADDLDRYKIVKNVKDYIYKNLFPTPNRPYNIAYNLFYGQTLTEIYEKTGIDHWFIERIQNIVGHYKKLLNLSQRKKLNIEILKDSKKLGFSDKQLGEIFNKTGKEVRLLRKKWHIIPKICQIDTLAGEFPAKTNYLYLSYHRDRNDIEASLHKQVAIIGGGPYQIGSSVEFDWCAVNCALTTSKLNYRAVMINCNPETVSTDYDMSDKLYFEELTLERILDILDFEKCPVIASVGGQIPNSLATKLESEKIKFFSIPPAIVDKAENREKFSALLDQLQIKQPEWKRLSNRRAALDFSNKIGYPVLIRPSYVLSGKAMYVAYSRATFEAYLQQSDSVINPEYPLVISKFIRGAKEIDFDAVAQKGEIIIHAISEHVENAGVHSGDATMVLPSFTITKQTQDEILKISKKISEKLNISGPFNIQYLADEPENRPPKILVIEANLRASRSFPFVSKVLGINFIELATKIMLKQSVTKPKIRKMNYFGVKAPHFSFTRLRGADPVLRVEMASTGEVACFGKDLEEAYLKAILSTGIPIPTTSALLSLGGNEAKEKLLPIAEILHKMGFKLYATEKTSKFLDNNNIPTKFVYKVHHGGRPNVVDLIRDRKVSLVINLSDRGDLGVRELKRAESDGYLIRRASVDANVLLFTKASIASLFVFALNKYSCDKLEIRSWDEYVK